MNPRSFSHGVTFTRLLVDDLDRKIKLLIYIAECTMCSSGSEFGNIAWQTPFRACPCRSRSALPTSALSICLSQKNRLDRQGDLADDHGFPIWPPIPCRGCRSFALHKAQIRPTNAYSSSARLLSANFEELCLEQSPVVLVSLCLISAVISVFAIAVWQPGSSISHDPRPGLYQDPDMTSVQSVP